MSDGTGERLAGLIGALNPSGVLWEYWVGQLRSGPFEYGFGVLRDGADHYDPMGVLAEINDVDWAYDEGEGAYAVDGQVDFLSTDLIRSFLAIPRAVPDERISQFATAMAELADSETSHLNVANALYYARQRGAARRNLLESALSHYQRERHPAIGDYRLSAVEQQSIRFDPFDRRLRGR